MNMLDKVKNAGKCPRCGHSMVAGDIDYGWRETPICKNCGYEELSTDYEGRCGNCHEELGGKDKYCRYCGTKRGEGKFEPYKNVSYCIYGPAPKLRFHSCKNCGYEWKTQMMVDDEKYCPKCGEECKITEEPEKIAIPNWIKEMQNKNEKE